MGQLLPELYGELEILRCAFHPVLGEAGVWRPVKRAVNLDDFEGLAVILQLVYLSGGIEITFPGTFSLGVRPTGSADVDMKYFIYIQEF